jgi:hypothetical protein
MRKSVSILSLFLLGLAAPCLAQYASPQTAARSGHWVRVPRAAPQAAPRDLAPPVSYEVAAPRQRIEVRELPAVAAPATWTVTGYRYPLCGRHKVKLGQWLIRQGSPRPVLSLATAPTDTAAIRVVVEQPAAQAQAPAPAEDLVYVPDEEPVFAPRDVSPPSKATPPVPTPREVVPRKVAPRAVAPRKVAPRAVPSPQADGDQAPPPPVAEPIAEPTETEPMEGEGGW